MKKTFDPRTIPYNFKALKYEELVTTVKYLNGLMDRAYPQWLNEQVISYQKRTEESEKRRQKELALYPKIRTWLESNLKTGMYLKFKGASRKGIRIAHQDKLDNDLVICKIPSDHHMTTNSYMNLTHVRFGNEWKKYEI